MPDAPTPTSAAAAQIPPPPRATGDDAADFRSFLKWFSDFYLSSVRNAGLLRADQQFATPGATNPTGLPEPTNTTLATAQQVANDAYNLARAAVPATGNVLALAGLTGAANEGLYFTAPEALALYALTAFGRSLGGVADAAAGRTLLGITAANALITAIGALSPTVADRLIYTIGVDTVALATLTGFARSILDDPDAATVRATINAIASTVALAALGALTPAADRLPYFNGASTAALAVFTSFGRSLVDDADAAAGRTTLSAAARRWFDVKDYGAVGDNSTDDTAAVQAALTALQSATFGGVLYVPAGKYKLTSQLTFSAHVPLTIIGDGREVSILNWTAAGGLKLTMGSPGAAYAVNALRVADLTFATTAANAGIALEIVTPSAYNPQPSYILERLLFREPAGYWTTPCKVTGAGAYATFSDVNIQTFNNSAGEGIYIHGTTTDAAFSIRFHRVEINAATTGIKVDAWVENVSLVDCSVVGCVTGVLFDGTTNPNGSSPTYTVIGGHYNNKQYDIRALFITELKIAEADLYHGVGSGTDVAGAVIYVSSGANVQITGNTIGGPLGFGSADYGVRLIDTARVTVEGNIFRGTDTCLSLENVDGAVVANNLFTPYPGGKTPTTPIATDTNCSKLYFHGNNVDNTITTRAPIMGAGVYLTANQSIADDGNAHPISFSAFEYDPLGLWDSATKFIVPAGFIGYARPAGQVAFNAVTGTQNLQARVWKNGTAAYHLAARQGDAFPLTLGGNGTFYQHVAGGLIPVTGGDYLELAAFHASGGAIDAVGVANGNATWFSIELVT